MVMVSSRILLALCFAFAADSKRLISEECGETQLKQIFRCADKGRKEIVDLITFECFEIGKRGPCDDGDLFVLNKDSDCWVSHCINNGGCEEEEFYYEGDCWNMSSARIPCERKGDLNHILVADAFGNVTCQEHNLSTRGVFSVFPLDGDIPDDVKLGENLKFDTIEGNIKALHKKLCSIHCGRNLRSFYQCSCDGEEEKAERSGRRPKEIDPDFVQL